VAAGSRRKAGRSKRRILVLSGPNLQLLGTREPGIYGKKTLAAIHAELEALGAELGAQVECRQSNHEGALVDWIGAARDERFEGILINPGAYTHTSLAIYDALKAVGLPAIEIHLSNPESREPFRHRSLVAPACTAKVAGFGPGSYALGLRGLLQALAE
jgi:3-dehydroquinate dehydratase-2